MHRVRCVLMAFVLGTVSVLTLGATTANALDAPPTNTARPGITGVVAVGETVTADHGTWDPADVTYSYTWLVDDQEVGSGEQYTPVAEDEGHALSLEVTASRPDAAPGSATSEPVTVLEGDAPQNLETPVVAGDSLPGGVVQVTDGTWDTDGLAFTYQWMRGDEPIAGATGPSYSLTRSDWCQELVAVVTAHEAGHASGVVTSDAYRTSCVIVECCVPVSVQIHVPQHVTTRDRATIRVRIAGAGNGNPDSGRVTLSVSHRNRHVRGGRWTHMVRLHDSSAVNFRLPRLSAGKYRVAARYDRTARSRYMDGDNVTVLKVTRAE